MARGRLEPPNLDDRKWQEIVDQAKALIPKYAPEWTDHNPSDLGITLIELFAWMVEGLIYRLNRVPEKTYIHMLNLLGITRDPATPASTVLTFVPNGTDPVDLKKGDQFATKQTETEDAVVFEVEEVLPNTLDTVLLLSKPKEQEKLSYDNITETILGDSVKKLTGQEISVDSDHAKTLALGFRQMQDTTIVLWVKFSKPLSSQTDVSLNWSYSDAKDNEWPLIPLSPIREETKNFQQDGLIVITIPSDQWAAQNPKDWQNIQPQVATKQVEKELWWLGVEIKNNSKNDSKTEPIKIGIDRILQISNQVKATNALTVQEELKTTSTGTPFQAFELTHHPLYKELGVRDPYRHVKIEVQDLDGNWQAWQRSDDFPHGDSLVYRLEPVTGTIYFGNNSDSTSGQGASDGHGRIPPKGSKIRATYRYVANGAKGNIGAGTVTEIRKMSKGSGVKVTNLLPATGGSDEESIEETKRRAPQAIRTRDRAVTVADYEYLVRAENPNVKKVRCLPPRLYTDKDADAKLFPAKEKIGNPWRYGGMVRDRGRINMIIVPEEASERPVPSEAQRKQVRHSILAKSLLTVDVEVHGPFYVAVNIVLTVKVWKSSVLRGMTSTTNLKTELETQIKQFLHPLYGGKEGTGWEIGDDLFVPDLLEYLRYRIPPSIGYITSVTATGQRQYGPPEVEKSSGNGQDTGRPLEVTKSASDEKAFRVAIADYELICSGDAIQVSAEEVD